ncbi:MAG TPA: biopolymer transporter Tol, partial [Bacteroidetes bacterium]|nr:biopolymer transporter Tol [Bacteroidota bacterium]
MKRKAKGRGQREWGQWVTLSILVFAFFFFPLALFAQEDFYHPELTWRTIETEHFLVHYHDGAERTARTVSKIAEEVYEPVTSLYNHKPDQKVSWIIHDHDDYSNGAAYFYDNKVEIWAPSMDFVFRGTHNWLRNVITHEFTHIVQIQTAMKFGRKVPSFYLQWLGYEAERRPDVLYGYPNVIASYPISGFVVPAWFAEGVAQYNRKELRYDFWDTHRDMILRSYALDSTMLTWEQMAVFGKNSLGNESSYNAGFAFVHYLAQKYGEEKLEQISRNLASFGAVTIGGAIEDAVGKSGEAVYEEWKSELAKTYAERVAPVRSNLRAGEPLLLIEEDDDFINFRQAAVEHKAFSPSGLATPSRMQPCCRSVAEMGFANLHPRFSPDGKKLAFVSTGNGDYLSQSSLYVEDLETHKAKPVQPGVGSHVCWSPDGKKLYYARSTRNNPHWSFQNDLYVFDADAEDETRLTSGKRAMSPSVSPDGSTLVFVVGSDGTSNLATMKVDGADFKQITAYSQGEQVYDPEWSPDGGRIVFDYSIKDGRDIAWVRPDGADLQYLVTGSDDSRSAVFAPDGKRIIFSSDRSGISNLYACDLESRKIEQLTNVLGGAFLPTVNAAGEIVYSAYASKGYKLFQLAKPEPMPDGDYHYLPSMNAEEIGSTGPLAMASAATSTTQFDWRKLRSYDDTNVTVPESKSYRNVFTNLTIVPFLRVDNYNRDNRPIEVIKPGVYLFSNDVLDKVGFFAGAAMNLILERDLFFQFNYRGKIPGLFQIGLEPTVAAEVYNVTRKTNNYFELGIDTVNADVTYNLLEFDLVFNQPFVSQFSNVEFRYAHSRYTAIVESWVLPARPTELIPGSSDLYLIANNFSLAFTSDAIVRSTTSEINPVGRSVRLSVSRELNKFRVDYGLKDGMYQPIYENINFTRVELKWTQHFPFFLKSHTASFTLHGGSILEHSVDPFFDSYVGGLVGMRGYPYYSLGGNEFATMGISYRFPLIRSIDVRFLQFYFDKLYASVFADVGNAWTGKPPAREQFNKDAGVELRLEAFSFYFYPSR